MPVNAVVARNLNDEEKFPVEQLLIDDEFGPLGPGGTRALMTSIMGSGLGMKGGPYKLLKSIRFWRSNCSDDGASAIVRRFIFSKAKSHYMYNIGRNFKARWRRCPNFIFRAL